jgi:hypothetical protein
MLNAITREKKCTGQVSLDLYLYEFSEELLYFFQYRSILDNKKEN